MTQIAGLNAPDDTPGAWTRGRSLALAALTTYTALLAVGWVGLSPLLPDHLTIRLGGHSKTIEDLPARILRDGSVMLAILPFTLWVEWMVVGWKRSSLRALLLRPTPSMQTDMAVMVLGQGHVL